MWSWWRDTLVSTLCIIQGWKWITPVDPLIHRTIWMWLTCWSFPFKSNAWTEKILIWNNAMAIDFFISRQDPGPVPCTDFVKMKYLDTTCFKTAWDNTFTPMIFSAFNRPKFTHLATRCQHCFLKNIACVYIEHSSLAT